jgi:2-amino-4-hydroxy-6-hydroxymethyldihydropteridine diphosphokinase
MILLALGANLSGPAGPPLAQCQAAITALEGRGIKVVQRSRWYDTPPDPPSGQPSYINGVVQVETGFSPEKLLAEMLEIEVGLGRRRSVPNAARSLDLDLIDYDGRVQNGPQAPILPHPRLSQRAFVLLPLRDIAPFWRHPVTGASVGELITALKPGHGATVLADDRQVQNGPGKP